MVIPPPPAMHCGCWWLLIKRQRRKSKLGRRGFEMVEWVKRRKKRKTDKLAHNCISKTFYMRRKGKWSRKVSQSRLASVTQKSLFCCMSIIGASLHHCITPSCTFGIQCSLLHCPPVMHISALKFSMKA